ncbi:MAG: hypothetical protein M5R40_16970 [Anaerolineae bacterium]|nr:hypothetical protein [Anaerolineae bacterium]
MTLKEDLKRFQRPAEPNPYHHYQLLENPFPGHGEKPVAVCTNQDEIKQRFVSLLSDFHTGAKRLRINGGSGAGKTNILRYFENLTNEARALGHISGIYPVYISAPGDSYFDIHGQIIERLMEYFVGDLISVFQNDQGLVNVLSGEISTASELLAAIRDITRPQLAFALYQERQIDIFTRWLKGEKVSAQEKKLLGYSTTLPGIDSASLAIRFLDGLLLILRKINLCTGIVLLFDEFEEIFERLTRASQARYAQDLRHLLDTLQESTFFVVATVPEPRDPQAIPCN